MYDSNVMARVAINKSVLKETKSREVFMDDGQEFQLMLFNSTREPLNAEIFFNNKKENGTIHIRPGERVWLERHLDKAKKLIFSIYEVDDSSEAREAIQDNGNIKVSFYKEENITLTYTDGPLEVIQYPYQDYWNYPYQVTAVYTSQENSDTETGRIEYGSISYQDLNNINDNACYSCPIKIEEIKILPISAKVWSSEDLHVKRYCTSCGAKVKHTWKFCPICGKKVE